ncbi:SRPBCC domain-containing protein, partial [Enterococcus faecium]|uniref:SRPBCC domain-containing protein n=1 Tax=Enterococcus faecium TaxID=1352 RepID=UPI0030C883D6
TDYPEWIVWTDIVAPERIVMLHGEHRDDPEAFESHLTFVLDGDRTRIEMRTVFPTPELRDRAIERHGALEGGRQTLDNLAVPVAERAIARGEG